MSLSSKIADGVFVVVILVILFIVLSSSPESKDLSANEKTVVAKETTESNAITDIMPESVLTDKYESIISSEALGSEIKINTSKYSFIKLDGEVSEYNYNLMLCYYCLIPFELRSIFQEDGWTIVVTSQNLEDTLFKGTDLSVCACTDSKEKVIYLEDSLSGSRSVVHEFGHCLSWILNNMQGTQRWEKLYNLEAETVSDYATANTSECFAESFDRYIREPDEFVLSSPLIYTYIDNLVRGIKENSLISIREEK